MRLWHIDLLPYLPDLQFKGQLRELVAIMHDWRDKGKTNHLLINCVMQYPKNDLVRYFLEYEVEYHKRYGKWLVKQAREFVEFDDDGNNKTIFYCWHDKEYLRICMANLLEKYQYGVGLSRIGVDDWCRLLDGYKKITGEDYVV